MCVCVSLFILIHQYVYMTLIPLHVYVCVYPDATCRNFREKFAFVLMVGGPSGLGVTDLM